MKCEECKEVEVGEPEYCCDGRECGCYGQPIHPMLCEDCWNDYVDNK
jgi:hypothetical protein